LILYFVYITVFIHHCKISTSIMPPRVDYLSFPATYHAWPAFAKARQE